MRRLGAAEWRDLPLLEENVVKSDQDLPVRRWPVIGVGRLDEHVAVKAHLLAVVLTDVRVVPVDARIWELHASREGLAHRHGSLRLVRSVVAILKTKAVPVHGGVQVTLVLDIDGDL